jgi:5-formyltetrahydrofolate cyclo-ligase
MSEHGNDRIAEDAEVAEAKHAARARARRARDSVALVERRAAAHELALTLLDLPELAHVRNLLAYASLPTELDPAPAIWRLRKRGIHVAYPRIEAPGVLGMHFVDHEMELIPGPFGLAQPSEHAPRAPHDLIDAVIVPGVAFDERGQRLGYGGGYYDRLLPMLRDDCIRVGIGFDEQILTHIPAADHDECVHVVVTPARVIRPDTVDRF